MSRYVQYSDVATCQYVSILLNCTENQRDVYQQETVKKIYAWSYDAADAKASGSALAIGRNQGRVTTRDRKKGLRRVLI